ncbi:MAG: hypothetical protein Tsb0010_05220 [Parvularculaceae bacterium]
MKTRSFLIASAIAAVIAAPALARQDGQGGGDGRGRGVGECATPPSLSLKINAQDIWLLTPEEVVALPGGRRLERGPQSGAREISLRAILPTDAEFARITLRSCDGREETLSGPWLEREDTEYALSITRKGFLKLTRARSGRAGQTILRDVRIIEARRINP